MAAVNAEPEESSNHNVIVVMTMVIFCGIYLPASLFQIWRLYNRTYGRAPMEILQKRQTSLSLICCIAYSIQFSLEQIF